MSRFSRIAFVALAAVGIASIIVIAMTGRRFFGGVQDSAEKRSETRSKEEEIVRKYILHSRAGQADPAKIEFMSWGPHDLDDWVGLRGFLKDRKKSISGNGANDGRLPVGSQRYGVFAAQFSDKPIKMVRVQYRLHVETQALKSKDPHNPGEAIIVTKRETTESDEIYFIQDDAVISQGASWGFLPNEDGDGWKAAWKKKLDAFK